MTHQSCQNELLYIVKETSERSDPQFEYVRVISNGAFEVSLSGQYGGGGS